MKSLCIIDHEDILVTIKSSCRQSTYTKFNLWIVQLQSGHPIDSSAHHLIYFDLQYEQPVPWYQQSVTHLTNEKSHETQIL